MKEKTVSNSVCVMNEIVLPNDTNNLGNMMGGRLLHMMDICAAISAQRHSNQVCVTAAVDSVEFESAIRQGEVVTLKSQVNRAFTTSMEIEINVWAENPLEQTRRKCNRAYFTFVAIDSSGKPTRVPSVTPETSRERKAFDGAVRRREMRLVLAGRMRMEQASNIIQDLHREQEQR